MASIAEILFDSAGLTLLFLTEKCPEAQRGEVACGRLHAMERWSGSSKPSTTGTRETPVNERSASQLRP